MRRLLGGFGILLAAGLAAACSGATAGPAAPAAPAAPSAPRTSAPRITLAASPLTEEQQIVHVLNRLGYGPRPGDVERVKQMGLAAYIERQLDPARIPDDAAARVLGAYPVLAMTTRELVREYPQPSQEARKKLGAGEMTRQEMQEMFPPERRPYAMNRCGGHFETGSSCLSLKDGQDVRPH